MHPFQFPPEQILDLVCLGVVVLYAFLPLFQIVLIVALVDVDGAVIHFHYGVRHGIKEIAVVGHHQERTPRMGQIVLQKLDAVDVQMVGRLVHHEEVRLAGKHHDDGRPLDLPARKHLHLTVIFTHSERGQKPADTLLIFSKMLRIKTSSPRFAVLDDLIPDGRLRVILILLLKERDADVPKEQDLAA